MPFKKITQDRVSDTVVFQIEQLILRGILRPGERLPSERDLAERLGVSRPSLREAISTLQDSGLLSPKASSGIFVADVLGSAFSEPLERLFHTHEEALRDYISFRRDLEGMCAERAAQLGTKTDIKVIQTIYDKMEKAHEKGDSEKESRLDADFHMAIVEASHNVIMLHMMRSMFGMLKTGVFYNRETMFSVHATRENLLEQHKRILSAIIKRDPKAARQAVEVHLDFVETCMIEHALIQKNEEVAKLRYEHEVSL